MHASSYKAESFVTCLSRYQSPNHPLADTWHHCTKEMPHLLHRCPCGIEWWTSQEAHTV